MFEHHTQPMLPTIVFACRMVRSAAVAVLLVGAALAIGVAGFHWINGLPFIDSLLNASMILSGMGIIDPPDSNAGKLFASGYALLSGVVILSTFTVIMSPLAHRLLHGFHHAHGPRAPGGAGAGAKRAV